MKTEMVWMSPPFGDGEPKEVVASPEVLGPLMHSGWNQCPPPPAKPVTAKGDVK